MNTQKIYYTNSIPGSGKTRWAISQMKKHLANTNANTIILYCAPTIDLLNEVYSKILEDDKNELRIHLIHHENVSGINGLLQKSFNLLHNRYISNTNSKQLADADFYDEMDVYDIKPGDIVLITHSAFWNSSFSGSNQTFLDKDKINLIIDEARDCYISSFSFDIIEPNTAIRFKKYLGFKEQSNSVLINPKKLSPARLANEDFSSYMFKSSFEDLFAEFTAISTRENIDLYALSAYDPAKQRFTLTIVRAPYDALYGWRKVILLSAFYSDSQLYHLLNCVHLHAHFKDIYSYDQIDISSKIIDELHLKKIKNRLKQTSISWIYDSAVSYTKYKYYIPALFRHKYKVDYTGLIQEYKQIFDIAKKTFLCNFEHAQFSNFIKALVPKRKVQWDTYLDLLKDKMNQRYLGSEENKALIFELIDHWKYTSHLVPINPTSFAAIYSQELVKRWCTAHGQALTEKSYLLSVNINDPNKNTEPNKLVFQKKTKNSTHAVSIETSKLSSYENWNENMPDIVKQYAEPLIGNPSGLNMYSKYDTVVLISSYLPPQDLVNWFSKYCPTYDVDLDFNLGQTIQVMMRCSIRDESAKNDVFVVLNSREQAQKIRQRLLDLPVLVDPDLFDMPKTDLINVSIDANTTSYKKLSLEKKKKIIERNKAYYKSDSSKLAKARKLLSSNDAYYDFAIDEKSSELNKQRNYTNVKLYRAKAKYGEDSIEYKNELIARNSFTKKIKNIQNSVKREPITYLKQNINTFRKKEFTEFYKKRIIAAKKLLESSTLDIDAQNEFLNTKIDKAIDIQ